MTENQKLREALKLLLASGGVIAEASANELQSAIDDPDADEIVKVQAAAVLNARQALTTTEPEPEPTGMPEVKPWDHPEPQTMRWSDLEIRWIQSYGEQCWKAGYKHGAWADKPDPTSKQSLQVEPAVNQQLTTEPVDEREAFEREMSCEEIWGHRSLKKKPDGRYGNWCVDLMWAAWQARAAMAQVSDINVVESFTNDTKDALMAGRAYAQEALIRFDDAYDRHPSTEPERNAILADIQLIDAAMAKGVK